MIKLRILLLRNSLYYIILAIALIYFILTSLFIKNESIYKNQTNINCIITNILIKDYGIKMELTAKEKIIGYYYIDEKEIVDFTNKFSLGDKINIDFINIRITNNTVPNTFNYIIIKYIK